MTPRLIACLATLAAFAFVPAAQARPHGHHHGHHGHHHGHHGHHKKKPKTTVRGIVAHQRALQTIADMNGGTRHTETPGYTASVAYVRERMKRAGLDVKVVEFNMPEWRETAPPEFQQLAPENKTYVPGTAEDDNSPAVDYITFEFSPTKEVTAPVVPVNNNVVPSPAANSNTAGCDAADFPAATAGAISLIQRGTCPFVTKLANAQAAGAIGVILFNEGDSPGRMNAGFRSGPTDLAIPAVFSSFAVGNEFLQAYKAGKNPTARLKTNGVNVDRFFPQVIAETKHGSDEHVVLAGAHLDSVTAGPGINDDGSGTSWQLDLAEEVAKLHPRNTIRFMWFGGEEDGLVGSLYYAANLSDREAGKIDVMIDTDMIASPNYVRLVYDGDGSSPGNEDFAGPPGAGTVEEVFLRYFQRRGMATLPQRFDNRSDYAGFNARGIPSGGLFAGAEVPKTAEQAAVFGGVVGEQYDPCYHEPCDTIATVTGQPPADTMIVYEEDPTPANLAIAQQQADSLNGNALKALGEFRGALDHALWFWANQHGALPPRATATAARKKAAKRQFRYLGHKRLKR